jgi:hypothetical protein
VVTSMPFVMKFSGWPGVTESHWRKFLRSSFCRGASAEGKTDEVSLRSRATAEKTTGEKKRARARLQKLLQAGFFRRRAEWIFRVDRATRARAARAARDAPSVPTPARRRGDPHGGVRIAQRLRVASRRAYRRRRRRTPAPSAPQKALAELRFRAGDDPHRRFPLYG